MSANACSCIQVMEACSTYDVNRAQNAHLGKLWRSEWGHEAMSFCSLSKVGSDDVPLKTEIFEEHGLEAGTLTF